MLKLPCSIKLITDLIPTWLTLQGVPPEFPPEPHTHALMDIIGLSASQPIYKTGPPTSATVGVVGKICISTASNATKHPFICVDGGNPIIWASASPSVVWNSQTLTWRRVTLTGLPGAEVISYAAF
jgi:hypothetical protein